MPVLDVPYFVQPTSITCQSTCLRMAAVYFANRLGFRYDAPDIQSIWQTINTDAGRPSTARNAYVNMVWWLERQFPGIAFTVDTETDSRVARRIVATSIDSGSPVLASTNHARTSGHIILVIGYEPLTPADGAEFICHDPYGRFDPSLGSRLWGRRRFEGGMSIPGGERGPGQAVHYSIDGIRRIRADKHSTGTFYLIHANQSIA